MSEPINYDEFVERFEESQTLPLCNLQTGLGMPCPFCAAPGFTKYPIFEHEGRKLPHPPQLCEECHRIGIFFFEQVTGHFGIIQTRFYVLQRSGPLQPDWFDPRIGWVQ